MDTLSTPTAARFRLVALFVLVAVGFALFRQDHFVIWNDSHGVYLQQSCGPEGLFNTSLGRALAHPFEIEECGGYRPLALLFYSFGLRFLYVPHGPAFLHLLLIGSLYGGLAVAMLGVAQRFVRTEAAAGFAVLLALASPPLAATSWVFLVGVQAIVPLLICLGLLCYWKACEVSRGRGFFLACLALILLAGPWFREFLGIVPILIGFLEVRRARRLTPMMGLAIFGLLHAVYPMALIKLLFLPELPLRSVFALGNLGHVMEDHRVRWQAGAHFLPLFPPLLMVLGATAALTGAWARGRTFLDIRSEGVRWRTLWPALAFSCWLVLVVGLLASRRGDWLLPVVLCLGVAVLGLQRELFLPFWFLASFVPILRVFTEHIHFLYAIVPAAIILAGAAESLWLHAAALRGPVAWWARLALAACLVLAAADQVANLYGVSAVNRASYGGIEDVAQWLRRHVPAGSVIVSNVIHGEEIKWRAGSHIENFSTKEGGVKDPGRVVGEPAAMRALLGQSAGKDVYLLDVDYDYPAWKADYHRHRYVHRWELPCQDLGVVHRTLVRYFFIDPLHHLVPRDYVPFLGAPDLVDDFYSGPSQDGRPFTYEVAATYHVYRVTGDAIRPAPSAGPAEPQLVSPRPLAGYNVVAYKGWYYGIPLALGPMDLQKTDVARLPGVIRDLSKTMVETAIHRLTGAPGGPGREGR
jgi:hypothetical protein